MITLDSRHHITEQEFINLPINEKINYYWINFITLEPAKKNLYYLHYKYFKKLSDEQKKCYHPFINAWYSIIDSNKDKVTLKQIKKILNNDTNYIIWLLHGFVDLPLITTARNSILLSKDSKLNYNCNSLLDYKKINFKNKLYFTANTKNNILNKNQIFSLLKNKLSELIDLYDKAELIGYKELTKISNKLKLCFDIIETDETINIINEFININFTLQATYIETDENVFDYYITLHSIKDSSEYNHFKKFENLQEYNSFKKQIRKIYLQATNLYNTIIQENKSIKQTNLITGKETAGTITTYRSITRARKTTNNELIKLNDNLFFSYSEKAPTVQDEKYRLYVDKHINNNTFATSTSKIELQELFDLIKATDKKNFIKRAKTSLINYYKNYAYVITANDKQVYIFPFIAVCSDGMTHYISWNPEYLKLYKNQHDSLKSYIIHKKCFETPNSKTYLFKLNMLLNRHYYFKKNGKTFTNQLKDSKNNKFAVLKYATIIDEIGLLQAETTNNNTRYENIKETLFNLLNDNDSIVNDWFLSDKNGNTIDNSHLLKPAKLTNYYIRFSINDKN